MFARAVIALLTLPGTFAFAIPLAIGWFDPWRGATWWPAILLATVGAGLLVWCVRDFYVAGRGTLAPWSPPSRLVVVGLYRFVRNPMYVAILVLVIGLALLYRSPLLAVYTLLLAAAFHLRIVLYEEPTLNTAFGDTWRSYAVNVPRWLPQLYSRQRPS